MNKRRHQPKLPRVLLAILLLPVCACTRTKTPVIPAQRITIIVPTNAASTSRLTIPTPSPTRIPAGINSEDVRITLSVDQVPPDPVEIMIKHRLIVIPPPGWGEYGWDVIYDQSMLRLEPDINPKIPSKGMWIWTAMKTGNSQIIIRSIPLPCENQPNPCIIPDFTSNLHVIITP